LHNRGTAALGCREGEIIRFDWWSPAELFTATCKSGPRATARFATAAQGIGLAALEFPAIRALGAWMQVGNRRFNSEEIHD